MPRDKTFVGGFLFLLIGLIAAQCQISPPTTPSSDKPSTPEPHYGLIYYSTREISKDVSGIEFGGLYLVDLLTKEEKHLTKDSIISLSDGFSWSPVTRRLVYTERGDDIFNTEQLDLYSLDLGNNNRIQLTNNDINDSDPQWSPNGKTIAFWSTRSDKWLYIMGSDGSNVRPLFKGDLEVDFSFLPFAWSPDSHNLAVSTVQSYTEPIDLDNLQYGFQIVELDSGKIESPLPDTHVRVDFSWSPDSSKLVYLSDSVPNSPQPLFTTMYILDVHTQKETLISEFAAIGPPHWSPTENVIAFTASTMEELYSTGQFNVYLINSDGTNLRRITHGESYNVASWSPDSRNLALEFVGEQLTGNEIYVLDINSGELEQITDNNVFDAFPIWVELN